ncbi:hypothetical protein JXA88_17595 [Candidatus Fermentibacteria bacterium]|nr:hypothetical protein [Candidatus Fermentibacteria bacterium]
MKQTPRERRIEMRMEEGTLARDGFLGDDPLRLDRMDVDARVLADAGISREEIGEVLQGLWQRARALMGEAYEPVPGVTVEVGEARGRIPCPFGHPGIYAKGVMTIEHGDRVLRVSPLSIHMIRSHGFFGGRGSMFRIEPDAAADLVRRLAAPAWQ